jgi:hypothetical protein
MADARECGPDRFDAGAVPQLRSGVTVVPVGDDAVLYDERTGAMYQLDVIAATVCRRFDGRASLRELANALAREFAAPHAIIEMDLLGLVRQLDVEGLFEPVSSAAARGPGPSRPSAPASTADGRRRGGAS